MKLAKAHCHTCKKTYEVDPRERCPFCDSTDVFIENMKKYSTQDFKGLTSDERLLGALTAIANEMHNVYTVLWKRQKE